MAIKKLTPFRLWVLQNFPFIAEDFDALTNYELMCKIVEYLNNVIDVTNEQSKAINELLTWFDNLDVQDEVNNKLDEMVESGELQEIITAYLEVNGVLGFNNLNDLKNATNLLDGSITRTLGNINYLDGKGSYYKIRELRNTDVIDEINIISLLNFPTLIAELIPESKSLSFDSLNALKTFDNIYENDVISTLGYYEKNDGGKATYKVRLKTESDEPNDMDLIQLANADLVADIIYDDVINPKVFGAKGNNTDDDSTILQYALDKCIELNKDFYLQEGTYLCNTRLQLKEGILNITGNNNAIVNFHDCEENFAVQSGNTTTMENIKIINDRGIAYNINQPNIVNTRLNKLNIVSTGYGILVNNNTNGGKDLFITENNIKANADAIEINTTSTDATKFHNIIISNNVLNTENGSGASAGFGIGVATGKNLTITGNIIENSRNEAIHIEDGTENISVVGNVLKECQKDGIILYRSSKSNQTPTITNNVITSANKNQETTGIYSTYTERGFYEDINISNNYIKNFDKAIKNYWYGNVNADGLIADDCNICFDYCTAKHISGNITLKNGTKLGRFVGTDYPCVIDSVTADSLADDWLSVANNSYVNIKNLYFNKSQTEGTGNYHDIKLFKVPKSFKATFDIHISYSNYYSRSVFESQLNNAGTLTNNVVLSSSDYGAISGSYDLKIVDGYLVAHLYAPNIPANTNVRLRCNINGNIIFTNYNN